MKVQLLVSEWCVPCRSAEAVWQEIAQEKDIAFEVLDVGQPEGRTIVARLGVRTVPSTVIDGVLKHLGVPTLGEARTLVAPAPARAATAVQYVGLSLGASSGWAICAAAVYLFLAGAAFLFEDVVTRTAALHVFGLGFAAFSVFGFGEHLLPRFTGAPIRGGAVAWLQQAAAHGGTILLAAGLYAGVPLLAIAGGALAWCAFALFAVRLAPLLIGR
jgi:thiol-disulfide isomerase/thioredoxin